MALLLYGSTREKFSVYCNPSDFREKTNTIELNEDSLEEERFDKLLL